MYFSLTIYNIFKECWDIYYIIIHFNLNWGIILRINISDH
jgi:hypothetical protein